MIPILYEATELNFTSNGVCRLAEATECHVTEERNGEYELTLTYPITGKYYDQIQEGMYIAATHDDKSDRQPFRIYRRSAPLNGIVQFFAHHISYALNNIVLNPITATSAADAFDQMETDTVTTNPFTMWTDVTTSGDFKSETPSSIRSALGGKRGSILDVYGGEYEWDMLTVKLHAQRGLDTDVTIRYGKNLTDLTQVIDAGGLYNAIVPYWFGTVNDTDTLITLPEHYVAANGVTNPVMVVKDFSNEWQDAPTVAQLRSRASSFLSSNRPWIPNENIKISFVQLWQTEEYKDVAVLQRLSLCDRVNVYYPALGITAEGVKIIKTNYNVLLDRYDEMELGDARSSFADTLINPIENAIEEATQNLASKGFMQRAIDYATKMITGGMGGNIVYTFDANGWPIEQLMMDTKDKNTAVNVWRWNLGGFGHSHSGYDGPFDDIAITQDGKINASMITVGTMLANRIKGGTLSLGGVDNGNGVLHVYDASGNLIGKWDKDGADITGNLTLKNENVTAAISSVVGFLWSTSGSAEYVHQVRAYAFKLNGNSWGNNSSTRARSNAYAFVANDMLQLYKEVTQSAVSEYFNNQPDRSFITKKGTNYSFLMEYSTPGQYLLCNKTVSIPSGFNGETDYSNKYVNKIDSYTLFMVDDCIGIGSGLSRNSTSGSSTYVGGDDNLQVDSNKSFFYISPDYGGIHMEASGGGWAIIKGGLQISSGSSLRLGNTINSEALINTSFEMSRQTFRVQTSSGGWSTVQYASSSSKRYKHDIAVLTDEALDPHKLYDLPVRQFTYNEDVPVQYEDMRDQTLPGFIAEEVAEIYPSAVIHNQDGDIESWDERRIIPGMLALIQEQKKQIDDLQARLEKLENLVNTLM